ncbi:MAG: hypothetical protein M3261_08050 [Thermoproteota archaeon]|nr:hypothetical protein [Thermoproteota archaeon]
MIATGVGIEFYSSGSQSRNVLFAPILTGETAHDVDSFFGRNRQLRECINIVEKIDTTKTQKKLRIYVKEEEEQKLNLGNYVVSDSQSKSIR